ncbi:nuclear transport factor 2 family protein [Zhongshania sp.]|uniref:nuclear transport factor 2 family protein n=1 Tax=Zhongshania sp. TaxID=1971902 RepID=UPI003564BF20
MSEQTQAILDAVADRFWTALDKGNMDEVMACCLPSATTWHNFDQKLQDFAETKASLSGFVENSISRHTRDIQREYFSDGFVQEHILEVQFKPESPKVAWHICVLMRFKDGKINSLREYIAPQASFTP